MTYINDIAQITAAEDIRKEYIAVVHNPTTLDILAQNAEGNSSVTDYSYDLSSNVTRNYFNPSNFSQIGNNAVIIANTLDNTQFNTESMDTGLYHVKISFSWLCNLEPEIELLDSNAGFFRSWAGTGADLNYCRNLMHYTPQHRIPNSSLIEYFKYDHKIVKNKERHGLSTDNLFVDFEIEYTMESTGSQNIMPYLEFMFKSTFGSIENITTDLAGIFSAKINITQFDANNPKVVDLFF